MDSADLRKVQLVQLEIAKEIKRICEDNGISYWLDAGSLLGAVRHNGFIPWDDDLDIGMLRRDYERFLQIAPMKLKKEYQLMEWKLTPESHYTPFAKVRKLGTIYQEARDTRGKNNGIYVDIFPYDVFPIDQKDQKWQRNKVDLLKKVIAVKHGDKPWKRINETNWIQFAKYIPIIILSWFTPEKAKDYFDEVHQKFNEQKGFSHYSITDAERYGQWLVKRECLETLAPLPFEDDLFFCPVEFDKYLTDIYGDYMQFPPVEKRELGHMIVKIDFGDEAEKGN